MNNENEPLDLSLDDLLTDDDSGNIDNSAKTPLKHKPVIEIEPLSSGNPTRSQKKKPGLRSSLTANKQGPALQPKGLNAVQYHLDKAVREEFYRIMPELMDEAIDHIVENLPKLINERMTTRLMDYLLENKKKILDEAVRDLIRN